MHWLKVIILSVLTLGVLAAGGYFGYNAAYASGETAGYNLGYPAGEESGYASGQQDGYDEGYTSGEQEGYAEGYDTGETEGYDTGYTVGKDEGYRRGFSSGETEGYSTGYTSGYSDGSEDALGHGYTLKDPTYAEALTFIGQDRTNENEYIEDTYGVYVCSHYSRDAGNNAEQAGFRCAYVELRYMEMGHAIIAFNTIDRGLVYFEPQTDERVIPEIGKRYYQCVIPGVGHYYEVPADDDTIMDILLIW